MGLSDLREVNFAVSDEQARARALVGAPDDAKETIEKALTSRVSAQTLPRISTSAGAMLVDGLDTPAFKELAAGQTTTDLTRYDPKLAEFLAAEAAEIPASAPQIAARVFASPVYEPSRPLSKDLACRLSALAATPD